MTVSPSILPAVCLTAHGYRNGICPAFPPHAAILSSQIFSADWAIWSGKAAALRKSRKPTVPLTITAVSYTHLGVLVQKLLAEQHLIDVPAVVPLRPRPRCHIHLPIPPCEFSLTSVAALSLIHISPKKPVLLRGQSTQGTKTKMRCLPVCFRIFLRR